MSDDDDAAPTPPRRKAKPKPLKASTSTPTSTSTSTPPNERSTSPSPSPITALTTGMNSKSMEYQKRFKLPTDEILIDDFVCALQRTILLQGRMYISQHYVCFHSKIFMKETKLIIPVSDITNVEKAKVALVIPNSIKIFTQYNEYFFASFLQRDKVYDLLHDITRGKEVAPRKDSTASHHDPEEEEAKVAQAVAAANADKEGKQTHNTTKKKKKKKETQNTETTPTEIQETEETESTGLAARIKRKATSIVKRKKSTPPETPDNLDIPPSPVSSDTSTSSTRRHTREVLSGDINDFRYRSLLAANARRIKEKKEAEEKEMHDLEESLQKRKREVKKRRRMGETIPEAWEREIQDTEAKLEAMHRRIPSDTSTITPTNTSTAKPNGKYSTLTVDTSPPVEEQEEESDEDDVSKKPSPLAALSSPTSDTTPTPTGGKSFLRSMANGLARVTHLDIPGSDRRKQERRRKRRQLAKQASTKTITPANGTNTITTTSSTTSDSAVTIPVTGLVAVAEDVSSDEDPMRPPNLSRRERRVYVPSDSDDDADVHSMWMLTGAPHGSDDESGDEKSRLTSTKKGGKHQADDDNEDEPVSRISRRSTLKRSKSLHSMYEEKEGGVDPRVMELNKKFKNLTATLATKGRQFIKEGAMKRQGRHSVVDRWCFLLSDVFLIAKSVSGGRYEMKQVIPLEGLTLDVRPYDFQRQELRGTKLTHPFRIMKSTSTSTSQDGAEDDEEHDTLILQPETADDVYTWAAAFQLAICKQIWQKKSTECNKFGWYLKYVEGTLHQAVYTSNTELIDAILGVKSSLITTLDQEHNSVLHIAAHRNNTALIPMLLKAGADVRQLDNLGRTPIHIAAKNGFLGTLKALLEADGMEWSVWHPAEPYQDLKTKSAIWLAALHHHADYEECIRLLIRHIRTGKPRDLLDARDDMSMSLLDHCAKRNLIDVVPVLIACGATLDAPNDEGVTALSLAVSEGNMAMVSCLIRLGAQPNLRTTDTLNAPIHLAPNLEIASYLVANGARLDLPNAEGRCGWDRFSSAQQDTLALAADLFRSRNPIETDDTIKPRAVTVAMNHGHPLDSCALCHTEFGTLMRAGQHCSRCGLNICVDCSTKQLIFHGRGASGASDTSKHRVCDGCFNYVLHAPGLRSNGDMDSMEGEGGKKKKNRNRADSEDGETSNTTGARMLSGLKTAAGVVGGVGIAAVQWVGRNARDVALEAKDLGHEIAIRAEDAGAKISKAVKKQTNKVRGRKDDPSDDDRSGASPSPTEDGRRSRNRGDDDDDKEPIKKETHADRLAAARLRVQKQAGNATGTASTLSAARQTALANAERLHEMEDQAAQVEEEAETMHDLSKRIKERNKARAKLGM